MMVDPLGSRYPTTEALLQFYDSLEQEVMAVPGVRSVAWASTLPLGPSYAGQTAFEIVGEPPAENRRPTADYQIVSPAYFSTLDLPIVAGRGFNDADRSGAVQVCVVNEAFVRAHVRGRSPIGLHVSLRPAANPNAPVVLRQIVGVARQVKGRPDETEDFVQIYVPLAQDATDDMLMVVTPKAGEADALAASVRAAIARVDKEQLVSVRDVMTLEAVAWEATARHRFRAVLVVGFAVLALLLAMVGLFGILAYSVQQRVRDFGVRRALGASTKDVLRPVVGSAVTVILAGAVVGLAISAFAGRLLSTMLFGVRPLDPVTFVLVTLTLMLTAILATVGPALRAIRVDPATALRGE
jgi:putative ABC transport system permease protein